MLQQEERDEYNGSSKSKTYDLVYIAVFAVLMAVCSWISVPTAVPFTLQTFAVFMAVGVLGGRRGTMSVALYIILGAVGVPVFAGMTGNRNSHRNNRRIHCGIFIFCPC